MMEIFQNLQNNVCTNKQFYPSHSSYILVFLVYFQSKLRNIRSNC